MPLLEHKPYKCKCMGVSGLDKPQLPTGPCCGTLQKCEMAPKDLGFVPLQQDRPQRPAQPVVFQQGVL